MITVIYGAAEVGVQALRLLAANGCKTDYFCDTNPAKHNIVLENIRVLSPQELLNLYAEQPINLVISAHAFEEILDNLKRQGADKWAKCSIFKSRYYLASEDQPCRHNLSEIYDTQDRVNSQYINLMDRGFLRSDAFFSFGDVQNLGSTDYFPDLFDTASLPPVSYLDLGAYEGESVCSVASILSGKMIQAFAFEPQKSMLPILKKTLDDCGLLNITEIFPFALGNTEETRYFGGTGMNFGNYLPEIGQLECGTDCDTGVETIDIKPLDSLSLNLKGYPFIKMDIEGMELSALQGMRSFIKSWSPCLAVCVYHNPYDEYVLPSFIKSVSDDYTFYLRGGFHAVCYAIPSALKKCMRKL